MTKLVFSYSHLDEALRNELEKHLTALQRQGLVDTWHDRRILAGQEWKGQIDANFNDADVILLLVSPDFIHSDYCYEIEMRRALERHDEGSAVVIPVILRPCHWTDLPFGKLQAATKDGKPIVHFPTLDDGFYEVVGAIQAALPRAQAETASVASMKQVHTAAVAAAPRPIPRARSSAMSVKQEFSDLDRDKALVDGFNAIVGYIEASLAELEGRNPGINTTCRRIDADSADFAIYRNGKRAAGGALWVERNGRWGTIKYSHDGTARNGYNESMSIEDDGTMLGLRPMGMAFHQNESDSLLTEHGAGEYFWTMLTDCLR